MVERNRNIFSWVKEVITIDLLNNTTDKEVNNRLAEGYQIINNRTEKMLRYRVLIVDGKETLQPFEVMITRYVMGR